MKIENMLQEKYSELRSVLGCPQKRSGKFTIIRNEYNKITAQDEYGNIIFIEIGLGVIGYCPIITVSGK